LKGFEELARLRDALAERARRERAEAARARQEAHARRRDENTFRSAMADVLPLAQRQARVAAWRPVIAPVPTMRMADEQAALSESLSDEFSAETLLEVDETFSWRRDGVRAQVVRDLRRGRWVLQDELDLHRLRSDEAREALATFLASCTRREVRCVRIVHGKGLGSAGREPVLKHKVPRWLVQRAEVSAFCQAREIDGGSGALLVLLGPSP
jgi:hypothetical protein